MATTNKSRIMIYGPKTGGTYVIKFRTAAGSRCRRNETAVLKHFQEQMPYGLFVPDVP